MLWFRHSSISAEFPNGLSLTMARLLSRMDSVSMPRNKLGMLLWLLTTVLKLYSVIWAYGNKKGLVEVLVGYSRRNTCVSILRVDTIDVLNQMFRIKCQKYVSHQVCGKEASIIDCRYYTVSLQFVLQSYSYHVALDVRFVYQYFSREYGHTQSIHSHIVFPLPAMHPSHCSQQ